MLAVSDLQAERAELEAVLSSDAFARSPIVAQMLKYICERHFAGQAHEIKEYNIAVEAFGRPANFDQARDSIVRVEAHRLRKRLQEYYLQQGAGHQIQITLPPGNYVPQFIRRAEPAELAPVAKEAAAVLEAAGEDGGEATAAIQVVTPAEPSLPDANPDANPAANPDANPAAAPGANPDADPVANPDATPVAPPEKSGSRRFGWLGIALLFLPVVVVAAFFLPWA